MTVITIITILIIVIIISKDIFKSKKDTAKLSPYECGFSPSGERRQKMEVSYYTIAILFIIFDLEVIFLLPYASVIINLNSFGYWVVVVFIIVLTIGFIYELNSGVLN